MKREYTVYCERKEDCCQRNRNGSKERTDGIEEQTQEKFVGGEDADRVEDFYVQGGLKPQVSA